MGKIETMVFKFRRRLNRAVPLLHALLFSLVTLTAALWTIPAYGGSNRWTGSGPEGGEIIGLVIHPSDPNTLYAGTGGGVYKSTNGGMSWDFASSGWASLSVYSLAIHPTVAETIYSATGKGLFMSADGVRKWSRV